MQHDVSINITLHKRGCSSRPTSPERDLQTRVDAHARTLVCHYHERVFGQLGSIIDGMPPLPSVAAGTASPSAEAEVALADTEGLETLLKHIDNYSTADITPLASMRGTLSLPMVPPRQAIYTRDPPGHIHS